MEKELLDAINMIKDLNRRMNIAEDDIINIQNELTIQKNIE
jgi:hypothetical protein